MLLREKAKTCPYTVIQLLINIKAFEISFQEVVAAEFVSSIGDNGNKDKSCSVGSVDLPQYNRTFMYKRATQLANHTAS